MHTKVTITCLFIALLIGTAGCKNTCNNTAPNKDSAADKQVNYQNLNEPIYLVLEESLWANCDNYVRTTSACRKDIESFIQAGVDDWFKHFDKSYRPKAVIVFSLEDVPADTVNRPIHVSMKKNGCFFKDKTNNDDPAIGHPACFSLDSGYPEIVLSESGAFTIPTAAHEFGHALGLSHPSSESTFSIMSPHGRGNRVLPIDMITLCTLHDECPPHDETWCEGTFYGKCRCPSESFEDGEAKRKEQKLVCE